MGKKQISFIFIFVLALTMINLVTAIIDVPVHEKSQKEKDCLKIGCFGKFESKCYSYGYIKNGTYCVDRHPYIFENGRYYFSDFINQSETGTSCIQGYECKTGVCSNNICVNLTEQQNKVELLNANFTKLSQENLEIKQNLENLNSSVSETKQTTEENSNLIQKIAVFLKNLFAFSK